MATEHAAPVPATDRDAADAADLARYGYKQELKRSLNIFSSFAVAFSYISPATGIFMLNIFGVRLVALINNTGVLFEILGLFVFAIILAAFNNHQGVGVVFHTGGPTFNASNFLIAMFMGLFVIYGFDTASTLAEESHEPRKKAPQAVLASIAAAGVIGGVFIWAMLMAVPGSMHKVVAGGGISPPDIIDANLSNALSVAYLLVVSIAIFVCCLSIQASTIRLAFGMSRDRQLPGSKYLSRVNH